MPDNRNVHVHDLGLVAPAIATGIGYYVVGLASLLLTRGGLGIATIWPPSGILFAVLLIVPRRRAGWHIAAVALASLGANLGSGTALLMSIGFTVANIAGSALAAWLVRPHGRGGVSLSELTGMIRFCMAALIGTMVSATIAMIVSSVASANFWFSWFSPDLVGALVVTPLILIGYEAFKNRLVPWRKAAPRIVAVLGLVALVSALSFGQSEYPLLFLPMLAVIIAAFSLGSLGAAGGVLIVAVIGSAAVSLGISPLSLTHVDPLKQSLFLQFYLLTLLGAALPIAALLSTRARIARRLSDEKRLLQLAESAAHFGHWRFDIATQTVSWSPEVFRIYGIDPNIMPSLDGVIRGFHAEDRAGVTAIIERSIELREAFQFNARLVQPGGEICHVYSRGEIDHNADDSSFGLFGIIQDITVQVAHEAAIEHARIRAEEAATAATVMAETDQLTGIANRRRTHLVLEQAISVSRRSGGPLSVAVFDVDHFKRVNDTWGHHAGDEVLKRIATDAEGELRNGDIVGRFGGEEFVIVLPDATAQTALLVAERVRIAIEAGGSNPCVTISTGVAELARGEAGDALLRRADQALYVAKAEGRNTSRLAA